MYEVYLSVPSGTASDTIKNRFAGKQIIQKFFRFTAKEVDRVVFLFAANL